MRSLPILVLLFMTLTLPALAGDGVIEINQTCALQGGCFAGDASGFPVTIATSGSYRLTGNLSVPDETTTAVLVTASGATIDLNGFEIRGPNVCSGLPITCVLSGSGYGVEIRGDRVRLKNGAITGMGSVAVYGPATPTSGDGHVIEDVRLSHNRFEGIRIDGDGAHVRRITSIANGTTGLMFVGQGNVVAESILSMNGLDGIRLGSLDTAQENQIISNGRFGIFISGATSYYRDNTFAGNPSGNVIGVGVNAGGNVCGSVACP